MLDKGDVFRAAEILTSGWCPLNCQYCYIPKSDQMKQLHSEIEKDLRSGKFLDRLETSVGDKLEYLSFWGTEPTLTLDILEEYIPEIFVRFPKLQGIMFSTSLLVHPDRIVKFAKMLAGRKIKYEVQISVDGHAEINDVNRSPGGAEIVRKNFEYLVREFNKLRLGGLKIHMMFKATHSIDNIRYMNCRSDSFDNYFNYFDSLFKLFDEINKSKDITIDRVDASTLVVPGKYTTNDGKEFTKYVREFHKRSKRTSYTYRLQRVFDLSKDLFKKRQFSCSGGDSNLGMDGYYHICHRTYYLNRDEYVDSILKTDVKNWDVSHFDRDMIAFIKENYIVKAEDFTRWQYVLRGYHDFWAFGLGYTVTMLRELALSKQVDEEFLYDNQLALLFAIFINVALSCPMENLLNTGTIHFPILSLLRMFGNGAFQEIVMNL